MAPPGVLRAIVDILDGPACIVVASMIVQRVIGMILNLFHAMPVRFQEAM